MPRGVHKLTATETHVGKNVPKEVGYPLVKARILSQTRPGPNGCIEWTGWVDVKGYGHVSAFGKGQRTHRLIWQIERGPIPKGKIVCHTCDNPPCCNIDHLWLGTIYTNGQDAKQKGRCKYQKVTHCKRGHPLSGDNLYLDPKRGWRRCRECQRTRYQRPKKSDLPEHEGK